MILKSLIFLVVYSAISCRSDEANLKERAAIEADTSEISLIPVTLPRPDTVVINALSSLRDSLDSFIYYLHKKLTNIPGKKTYSELWINDKASVGRIMFDQKNAELLFAKASELLEKCKPYMKTDSSILKLGNAFHGGVKNPELRKTIFFNCTTANAYIILRDFAIDTREIVELAGFENLKQ